MQTDGKASASVKAPSPQALKIAESAGRGGRRNAQVRVNFIERALHTDEAPPLARMLRGGRGGQVRLKLYLSYLWLQKDDSARQLAIRHSAWAGLLDLRDPKTAGARRISDAHAWLEENRFIEVTRGGRLNLVTVLDEKGKGEPWVAPGAAAKKEKEEDTTGWGALFHRYVQIPKTFWTEGYISVLSGAGVAMFLALLSEAGGLSSGHPLWFSPREAERRFALSEDTRSKGLRELSEARLITTKRRSVNEADFEAEALHLRNVHFLEKERLNETASLSPRQRVVRLPKGFLDAEG
ncbi:hypothetical protein [Streptomyces sp. NRRL F-5702]|uniref:hypothetical protein n=1 Tax=Streptomyces sp. NRRL F-5702 TaxID=1463870 RepID=UPI0004CB781C|nr:hypothetical protein [Streptomyces sp. NRRL F-5702]